MGGGLTVQLSGIVPGLRWQLITATGEQESLREEHMKQSISL